MQYPNKFAALALATAAVATLTACDPGPGEQAAARSSAAAASPSLSHVQQHNRKVLAEFEREEKEASAVTLPIGTNRELAEAAAKDGVPFVFAWSDWDERPGACAWIRTPDGALWSLSGNDGQLVRDAQEEKANRANPGRQPACFFADAPKPAAFDQAAADAAVRAGAPYRYNAGCMIAVMVPGNPQAYLMHDYQLRRSGSALTTPVERMGCPKEGN